MRLSLAILLCVPLAAFAKEPTPDAIRAAVAKALPRLWEGIDGHTERRACFTCHNHAVPLVALGIARERGFSVDAKKMDAQTASALKHYEAMRQPIVRGDGPGPAPGINLPVGGGVDNTGYAMFAFAGLGVKRNRTTELIADYTLGARGGTGAWATIAVRVPSEASSFTTTYLSMHALREYGKPADAEKIETRISVARAWMLKTPAKDTEDRAFKLLGLWLAGGTEAELAVARKELIDTQLPDGGFAQIEKREPDAYATGSALYALHVGGKVKTSDAAYRKGLAFLVKSQKDDGTWHVTTRSRPIQKYFETGFPYEKDQFISCAGTGWATAALALSLPASGGR